MALWLPKWLKAEQAPPEDETRRSFIFMGAAAGIVLAVAPSVELFDLSDMPGVVDDRLWSDVINGAIRDTVIPYIREHMNNEHFLTQYLDDGKPVCEYCSTILPLTTFVCPSCKQPTGRWS